MSNIITNGFRTQIAKSLERDFSDPTRSIYFFYGRPSPWTDDQNPPVLTEADSVENTTKSNIIALKRVSERDILLGIPANPWVSGTVYGEYSNLVDLTTVSFYVSVVFNNIVRVYKCLDNGSGVDGVGKPSTETPDHTDGIAAYSDGYVWQYMFRVSQSIKRKFTSPDYIPLDITDIENASTIAAAQPGTIGKVKVFASGSGYFLEDDQGQAFEDVPIFIMGNGQEKKSGKINIKTITSLGSIDCLGATINPVTGLPGGLGYDIENPGNDYLITPSGWTPVMIRQVQGEQNNVNADEDFSQFEYAYGIAKINSSGQIETMRIIDPGKGFIEGLAEVVQSTCIAFGNLNSTGGITSTYIPSYWGLNYTSAKAVVVAEKSTQTFVEANLVPLLSPARGHASNPESELLSKTVLFNVRIAYEELGGDFSVSNDFRTVGIIQNVRYQFQNSSGQTVNQPSTQLTLAGTTDITLQSDIDPNNFPGDSTVIGTTSGARGTVVEVVNNRIIRVIRNIENSNSSPFLPNEDIVSSENGNGKISSVKIPEYVPYSGDLLLINNREPIQRSADQIETINFILNI